MPLHISTRTLGDVLILDCHGEIVLGEETAALRNLISDLMTKTSCIVLNLTSVTRIDSNGIGTLIGLHNAASKAGSSIKLSGLLNFVKSVMETTRLVTFFEVFPTVEAAAASFAPAAHAANGG